MNPQLQDCPTPEIPTRDDPSDHYLEAHCPQCNHNVDAVCPSCGNHVESSGAEAQHTVLSRGDFYRRFVLLIQNSRNTKFTLGCYLIATGDAFADGVSMTDYAKEWGVKKATVSKHCRFICHYLGIPPSPYMRREETAGKFRLANRRPQKIK